LRDGRQQCCNISLEERELSCAFGFAEVSALQGSTAATIKHGERMRLLVLTFIFLFCGVSLVLAGESCPFLTNDDVERVTGRKLLFELTSMQLPGGEGTLCDSDIARVVVFSGENSEKLWENMLEQSGRGSRERIPVSDFNDKAYALDLEPRNEHEYPTALIVVTQGPHTAAVSVRAVEGKPANSAQQQAIELTKMVIAKLR
jgi:hypothetical protein